MSYAIKYLAILLPLVALDAIWIGFIASNFYKKHLGYIFAEKFLLWPAAIFYLIYAIAIWFFVVDPAIDNKSLATAVWRGAFLGLAAYGAYDLTNQATIAKWPYIVTLADLAWGVFVTAAASAIAYTIISNYK